MHHFESMPSLHLPSPSDPFPSSPPASPISFTSIPSITEKRSRHTHRRSLAISSNLTFPAPHSLDQHPAMITPPLSSPALSFPKTSSLESLRSGNTMLDYDSDLAASPNLDCDSLATIQGHDLDPCKREVDPDNILPDSEQDAVMENSPPSPDINGLPAKLRKVAFNDAIIYYPPRPLSSRQPSFSSEALQPPSREVTPTSPSPRLSHRRSFSSFLIASPTFLPSPSSSSGRHSRERKSWAGLIASPFTAARRRRSPNRYRPPTPPLGHESSTDSNHEIAVEDDDDEDDRDYGMDSVLPPIPVIDLDAALGPFQTPGSPLSSSHSWKFWSVTSHVGTHRRSESAPEIRALDNAFSFEQHCCNMESESDSRPSSRGLKRKMSVIDEEDRQPRAQDDMEIDSGSQGIPLQECTDIGEMGDLVIDPSLRNMDKLSKRHGWRKSFREWLKKV